MSAEKSNALHQKDVETKHSDKASSEDLTNPTVEELLDDLDQGIESAEIVEQSDETEAEEVYSPFPDAPPVNRRSYENWAKNREHRISTAKDGDEDGEEAKIITESPERRQYADPYQIIREASTQSKVATDQYKKPEKKELLQLFSLDEVDPGSFEQIKQAITNGELKEIRNMAFQQMMSAMPDYRIDYINILKKLVTDGSATVYDIGFEDSEQKKAKKAFQQFCQFYASTMATKAIIEFVQNKWMRTSSQLNIIKQFAVHLQGPNLKTQSLSDEELLRAIVPIFPVAKLAKEIKNITPVSMINTMTLWNQVETGELGDYPSYQVLIRNLFENKAHPENPQEPHSFTDIGTTRTAFRKLIVQRLAPEFYDEDDDDEDNDGIVEAAQFFDKLYAEIFLPIETVEHPEPEPLAEEPDEEPPKEDHSESEEPQASDEADNAEAPEAEEEPEPEDDEQSSATGEDDANADEQREQAEDDSSIEQSVAEEPEDPFETEVAICAAKLDEQIEKMRPKKRNALCAKFSQKFNLHSLTHYYADALDKLKKANPIWKYFILTMNPKISPDNQLVMAKALEVVWSMTPDNCQELNSRVEDIFNQMDSTHNNGKFFVPSYDEIFRSEHFVKELVESGEHRNKKAKHYKSIFK